ncbi:hypothetical protein T4D_9467 [Trichinella pseudospiralis]|uniref:Uncharacterized protein n=1 Tax=Trichinella pseudospiralis TaxID=6337 RepID=A0A0V1F440_TRIPS|nr:hypothetical protein T4D_10475 [Trichinella pseudospiralis]KRY80562.1 hypothetical protein T4D_9467 [Trichinella pseudospiralis]
MENLLHMSFLPINLATVKASATDIAHQAGPCGKVNDIPFVVSRCP